MSDGPWRPAPFPPQVEEQGATTQSSEESWCYYCGEEMNPGERCFYVLRGILKAGERSGRLYVAEDTYDKEEPAVIHELCVVPYFRERDGLPPEDGEVAEYCAGCESKLRDD